MMGKKVDALIDLQKCMKCKLLASTVYNMTALFNVIHSTLSLTWA